MGKKIKKHIAATHELLTKHLIGSATKLGQMAANGQTWTARASSGSFNNLLGYFSVNLPLSFQPNQIINFSASGTTIGFGGIVVNNGSAIFYVDPAQLVGATDISCQVYGVAAGTAVANVLWLQGGTAIGVGSFTGVGILTLPPPWNDIPGTFS